MLLRCPPVRLVSNSFDLFVVYLHIKKKFTMSKMFTEENVNILLEEKKVVFYGVETLGNA